jgi:hypothetical protein
MLTEAQIRSEISREIKKADERLKKAEHDAKLANARVERLLQILVEKGAISNSDLRAVTIGTAVR